MGASEIVFNEYLGGIVLRYMSTHGNADDSEKLDDSKPAPQDLAGNGW